MRENKIERYLIDQLMKRGISTRKVQWIGREGAPDRLVLINGGIFVELKATGQKPRANQLLEHESLRKGGMRVEVIDSMELVDKLVEELCDI